jgi:hypothetical protein
VVAWRIMGSLPGARTWVGQLPHGQTEPARDSARLLSSAIPKLYGDAESQAAARGVA